MGAPQRSGPSWVDLSRTPEFTPGDITNGQTWAFLRGSNLYLYQVFPFGGTGSASAMYKSTDDGSTWAILDAAHTPTTAIGVPFYDKANNRLIFAMVTVTFPQTQQALFLQNFDFITETWGSPYNTGGPSNAQTLLYFILPRSDGTFVVLYNIGPGHAISGHSVLHAVVLPVGLASWGADFDAGIVIAPHVSGGSVSGCTAAVDSSDRVHIWFADSNLTFWAYQQILPSNALGPSSVFSAATLGNPNSNSTQITVFGNQLLVPMINNSFNQQVLMVGTPLSSPVWTLTTPAGVQRSSLGPSGGTGMLAYDGINLYWMINWTVAFQFQKYQIFTSTDAINWTVVADNATAPYFYDFGSSPTAPGADVTGDKVSNFFILFPNVVGSSPKGYGFSTVQHTPGAFQTYFLNSEVFGASPPSSQSFSLSLYGWKLFRKDPCDTSTQEVPECPPVKWAF